MSYKKYECTLRVSSPSVRFSNISDKLSNVKGLMIKELQYTTASDDQEFLTISIDGFNHHLLATSGRDRFLYTKLIMLQRTANSTINYFNPETRDMDVYSEHGESLFNFTVTALIDKEFNSDISESNPLLLKLVFFYE